MPGTADGIRTHGASGRAMLTMASGQTVVATGRVSATNKLMAARCGIVLPTLAEIPAELRFSADEREMIALAETLIKCDVAAPEDWEKSRHDPLKYLLLSLERWIQMHGGPAIDHRFDLDLILSDRLVEYSDERGPADTLYLVLDPESAAFVTLTPTIELLENAHPRLPATFYSHFGGALNRWIRVYDYHDAEERVEMLREWYEGEENAEQYELPDVEGCTPKLLKEQPLSLLGLKKINEAVRELQVRALITGLLELCRLSRQAKRPEFTEDMGEQLMDSNPALPCLLAAFSSGDAVVGCFDDEGETALEVTPQPNVIIPLRLSDAKSVRDGFRTLAVVCETLAAASRLANGGDRPENGFEVQQKGVGKCLPRSRWNPESVADALNSLISSTEVLYRCKQVAQEASAYSFREIVPDYVGSIARSVRTNQGNACAFTFSTHDVTAQPEPYALSPLHNLSNERLSLLAQIVNAQRDRNKA